MPETSPETSPEISTETSSIAGLQPGLRVMVSAGAQGIGRAIAETFLAAGARVHICDVAEPALEECLAALPGLAGSVADVADQAQMDAWFETAQAHLGGLDIMINNAGISGPTGPVEDLAVDDWRMTVDINLNAMFYAVRRAVPLLKAAAAGTGAASMVNLSSIAGKFGYPYRTPYSASKWAVVGFTKSLSRELGPFGIRVNAIQPGPVAGPRIERVISAKAESLGISEQAMRDKMTGMTSMQRFVTAQDIANMTVFLCSEQGRNVSGQAIAVCADSVTIE